MRLLFVDHRFHRQTQSSGFFVDILARFFDVTVRHVDERDPLSGAAPADADLVLLWQMDFLAPAFLARGTPTVVAPMFDGSGGQPDLHWLASRRARFVNFSRTLHARLARLGLETRLAKYFKPASPPEARATFDALRVFFWQRRPEHGLTLDLVGKLLGDRAESVHLHDAPDDPAAPRPRLPRRPPFGLTRSTWFESRDDYLRALAGCNVFVAPRRGEGIGMAMLEAMGRGMLVIAADAPTHDEYVAHGVNGLLFDPDAPRPLDLAHAAALGAMAARTVEEGHAAWLDAAPGLVAFIAGTPAPPPAAVTPERFLPDLVRAYLAGPPAYGAWLEANPELVAALAGPGAAPPAVRAPSGPDIPWLPQNRLDLREPVDSAFVRDGRVVAADGAGWIEGRRLDLGFRIDDGDGAARRLRLRYRRPEGARDAARLVLTLNGRVLGDWPLAACEGLIETRLGPRALGAAGNILRLETTATPAVVTAELSAALGVELVEFC